MLNEKSRNPNLETSFQTPPPIVTRFEFIADRLQTVVSGHDSGITFGILDLDSRVGLARDALAIDEGEVLLARCQIFEHNAQCRRVPNSLGIENGPSGRPGVVPPSPFKDQISPVLQPRDAAPNLNVWESLKLI